MIYLYKFYENNFLNIYYLNERKPIISKDKGLLKLALASQHPSLGIRIMPGSMTFFPLRIMSYILVIWRLY